MSSFLLSLEFSENLASSIARFWWSSSPQREGPIGKKWEKLCLLREGGGGIGFKMIHEFNLALLAKQLWRLVQFTDSLVARVLWGKYYILSSPLRAGGIDTPSYIWTSLFDASPLLILGTLQKVHLGYDIKVRVDPWIPISPARPARTNVLVVYSRMTMSNFSREDSEEWDVAML